ncbi:MAG: ATP-binding protein, partial [Caldilineaceae bacterium]|nr:ATP-binding protein [Caldilineaceae bacterium]
MAPSRARQRRILRDGLDRNFNLEELQSLCFDLDVDYDNLAGATKRAKIEALIGYLELRGEVVTLITEVQRLRPSVRWIHQDPDLTHCPYRGLAAFKSADAGLFYGRDVFVSRVHQAVQIQPLVAVFGASGSGKSSIIFAGLLPRLQQEGNWIVVALQPTADPFNALATTLISFLEPQLDPIDQSVQEARLREILAQQPQSLINLLARIRRSHGEDSRLLLLVDQFEELYALCTDEAIRQGFLDRLTALCSLGTIGRRPQCVAVLVARTDAIDHLSLNRPFSDLLQQYKLKLDPLEREALRQVIVQPAQQKGFGFEAGLVDRILDDVGVEPGNLPLLELTLTTLWEAKTGNLFTHVSYEEIGCVEGVLVDHAEAVYEQFLVDKEEQARRLFLQLVYPGQDMTIERRSAKRSELHCADWSLVQFLADQRLITTNQSIEGEMIAEIAHSTLLDKWPRLHKWLEPDRDFRVWQEQMRSEMARWLPGKNDEDLLFGADLVEAAAWLKGRASDLNQSEMDFIQRSIAHERTRKYRNLLRVVLVGGLGGAIGTGVIIAVVGALLWRPNDPQFYRLPLPITVVVSGLLGGLFGGVQGIATTFGAMGMNLVMQPSLRTWVVGGALCSGIAGAILTTSLQVGGAFDAALPRAAIFALGFLMFALASAGTCLANAEKWHPLRLWVRGSVAFVAA